MDLKEKLQTIQNIKTSEQFIDAMKVIPHLGFSLEDNVAFIRRDIRADIYSVLKREGVSIRLLSRAIGIEYTNLVQYLKGTRPLPEKYLERIMGLLGL